MYVSPCVTSQDVILEVFIQSILMSGRNAQFQVSQLTMDAGHLKLSLKTLCFYLKIISCLLLVRKFGNINVSSEYNMVSDTP